MAEIEIPGDELEHLVSLLPKIKDVLGAADSADNVMKGLFTGDSAGLGDQHLVAAIAHFHGRWSDGHYQVGKEVKSLKDAAQNVLDLFKQTDQNLTDSAHGKTPPDDGKKGSSGHPGPHPPGPGVR
jgi:hypothetical protein